MTERELSFHGPRGMRLAGTLCVPPRADDDLPVAAVLLCQGLSGVKHLVLPEVADRLSSHGFASLRFDYAGYGDSDGDRGWIDPRARVADAAHALERLAAHEAVDEARLGAYGHSLGGPVAIALAARESRVRAVVSVSGPGSGVDLLRSLRPSWEWIEFKRRVREARERRASTGDGTPVALDEIFPFSPEFRARYEELKRRGGSSAIAAGDELGTSRFYLETVDAIVDFHPEDEVRRLGDCPLLLVHGEDDDVAPVETVEPVYANAPQTKRWHVLPGLGHNELDSEPGLTAALEQAANWFSHYLR
ncbi:MAG TPA: alpha/beta hydrolase [Solirubrobacteraceae bacterium]